MSDVNEQFNAIENSILWITKEIETLQKSQPLTKEQMLHAENLQKKLSWERRQIENFPN